MQPNLLLQPIMVDEEVSLRHFTLADAEPLFALTDKNRAYLRRWLAWLDGTKTVADTQKFIQTSLDQANQEKAANFGVYYRGTLVGVIGHPVIDKGNKKAEIGYWLDESSQGKGIMSRAVMGLIRFAFETYQLNRVEIHCAVGNNKSRAIPQRLHFTKEGVKRQAEWLYDHFVDWEQYSLLKSDLGSHPS